MNYLLILSSAPNPAHCMYFFHYHNVLGPQLFLAIASQDFLDCYSRSQRDVPSRAKEVIITFIIKAPFRLLGQVCKCHYEIKVKRRYTEKSPSMEHGASSTRATHVTSFVESQGQANSTNINTQPKPRVRLQTFPHKIDLINPGLPSIFSDIFVFFPHFYNPLSVITAFRRTLSIFGSGAESMHGSPFGETAGKPLAS